MQVTETLNEGLKRKLAVVIPAADLNERLDARLVELKDKANIKGFRPGKVPMTHLKKVYGRSAMSEVMSDAINATVGKALDERSERAATQPQIDLRGVEQSAGRLLAVVDRTGLRQARAFQPADAGGVVGVEGVGEGGRGGE